MNTNRRRFLRASGVALALPMLDAFVPRSALAAGGRPNAPRRMVLINASMGLLPQEFFPEGDGRNYQASRYLNPFADLKEKMTVFSGLSHPEVDGGHHAEICYLTAAPHPGGSGFKNTISVDQYAAERVGIRTRVPSLVLHAGPGGRKNGLSWTSSGISIPPQDKPSEVYKRLFITGSPQETQEQVERLQLGRSILDTVADRARSLQRSLGSADRAKLDEYFTSVRELERRLHTAEAWEHKPKPRVEIPQPKDIRDNAEIVAKARLMYQIVKLALQTDSTRIISLKVHSYGRVKVEGVEQGHHELTHHGNRPEALAQLRLIEEARLREFHEFLTALDETAEQGESLLDRTMVMYGSHMGDANRHTNHNLPVLLAGGGFRHGQHLAFDTKDNTPLCNLFVSMLQQMGIETDQFASSSGTLSGLDARSSS